MDSESVETAIEVEEGEEVADAEAVEEEEEVDPRNLLTKEQIVYYKEIYDAFDVNKKGVSTKTVGLVLRMMGLNPTKAEIRNHIEQVDPLGRGTIDFQSFLLPIAQRMGQEPETHEDIIAAFKILDEEELEFLTTDRLYEFLTTLGEDLEDFEIEIFLKMADPKNTGQVRYVEFVEKMMGIVRKSPKKDKKGKKNKKKK